MRELMLVKVGRRAREAQRGHSDADVFRANVVDGKNSLTIEATGAASKLSGMEDFARLRHQEHHPHWRIAMTRSARE